MNTIARDVRPGDVMTIDRLAYPFNATVATVEAYGRKAMGTDTPMLRFTFTDAPKVIKALEMPADSPVVLA